MAESKPDDIDVDLKPEDFVVNVFGIDYGKKEKNPIDSVYFYCKNNPSKAFQIRKEQVSTLLPNTFSEKHIRVYCKQTDKLEAAKKYFEQWCKKNNIEAQDVDIMVPEFSPITPLPPASSAEDRRAGAGERVKKAIFGTPKGQQH
ncbi:hypothetical protein PGIGA_G00197560 [Pangasianodon gigas]|uniref:Uncharacterized protein n=1 Tax=Pangasianodon gigas TaxID=30993 RepID=A0ACC5WDN9_PANGG|nr:hypothetical protein [Pangasianodon gigas]